MKQFLAIFFVSALVLTASAELNLKSVTELMTGFTTGMNFPELNPSFENCSISMSKAKQYANDVVAASESENPEAFAVALSSFGFSFSQSIRSCGKAMRTFKALSDPLQAEINNITPDSLTSRLLMNLMAYTMKFSALKLNFQNGNFVGTGENIAEIVKLFVFNGKEMSAHRQLSQFEDYAVKLGASQRLAADLFGVIVGVQGFIEEANTTVVVEHYTGLVNDTTFFVGQFPVLQDAIVNENFPAIVTAITNIYKSIGVVAGDYMQVKGEVSAFVQRDLPLFDNEAKIAKAVESLFLDLPTTLTNIMRITNAYKAADYRELGHGTGGVYNQLRKGAQN